MLLLMIEKKCLNCGIKFKTYLSANKKYCSHSCYKKHKPVWNKGLTKQTDKRIVAIDKKRIETLSKQRIKLICKQCRKEFKVWLSCKNRIYCSYDCYLKAPKEKKIRIRKCIFCGKEYSNQNVGVFGKVFEKRQYCSYKCWRDVKIKRKKEYWDNAKTHSEKIQEVKRDYLKKGHRIIKGDNPRPDLILIEGKDIKITAIEIETGTYGAKDRMKEKYKDNSDYDDVKWIFMKPKGVGYTGLS